VAFGSTGVVLCEGAWEGAEVGTKGLEACHTAPPPPEISGTHFPCSCLIGVKSGWSGGFKNGAGELGGGPVGKVNDGVCILFDDEEDASSA